MLYTKTTLFWFAISLTLFNNFTNFWQIFTNLAYKLLQKLQITRSIDHHLGSGREHSACTADNTLMLLINWYYTKVQK